MSVYWVGVKPKVDQIKFDLGLEEEVEIKNNFFN